MRDRAKQSGTVGEQGSKFNQLVEILTTRLGHRFAGMMASFLWPLYLIIRFLWRGTQYLYEVHAAPFLAVYLYWLFWPAYKLLAARDICFVVNTADGTGHIIAELDNFLRQRHLGQIDPAKRYVWIRPSNPFAATCVKLYRHHFYWAVSNRAIYYLLLPLTMKYRGITVDVGLSRSKWQIPTSSDDAVAGPVPKNNRDVFWISRRSHANALRRYVCNRNATVDYFPLRECEFPRDERLEAFLGKRTEKLALIHIRSHVLNASAAPTDPVTYVDTLGYLKDTGFSLVFVGREKMPALFEQFNILNYANSRLANFERDLHLFSMAKVAVVCASGLAYLPDAMQIPYLFINAWQLSMQMPSRQCIIVPALVRPIDGSLLSFREQMELFWASDERAPDIFPAHKFAAVNASSEDIVRAMRELLEEPDQSEEVQELQRRLWACDWAITQPRVSDHMLLKYQHLIS